MNWDWVWAGADVVLFAILFVVLGRASDRANGRIK